jgi:hypothetical protein
MTRAESVMEETLLGLAKALRPEARAILDLAPGDGDLALRLLEICRGARYLGLFRDDTVRTAVLRRLHGFDPPPAGRVAPSVLADPWGENYDLLVSAEPLAVSTGSEHEELGQRVYRSLVDGGACLLAAVARLPEGPVADGVSRLEGADVSPEGVEAPAGVDLVYRIRRAGFRQAEIVFRRGTRILLAAVR